METGEPEDEGLLRVASRRVGYRHPSAFGKTLAGFAGRFPPTCSSGIGGRIIRMAIGTNRTSSKPFEGVIAQLENLYATTKSEFTRKRLRAYQGRRVCRVCRGARLKPEILAVTLRTQDGREFGIQEMCGLTIAEAARAMDELQVAPGDVEIVKDVLREVRQRLRFLNEVGLGYLQLSRERHSLRR